MNCLINESSNQGVYAIGRINLRQDDTPVVTRTVELKKGDYVVFDSVYRTSEVLKIAVIADNKGYVVLEIKNKRYIADLSEIRLATNVEIKAGHRINHIVEPNDMGDSERLQQWKNNIPKFAGFRASNLSKNESQDYLAIKTDAQIIDELKVENVVLQAKVDELQAENKMLHEAAAKHLRNQNHFKGLYDALVEQLYPYALDLNEPVDGDVNITPPEFTNGYNLARECVHYNLLEMMESDEEYIRAQCDMLGGGGEAYEQ